MEKSSSKLAKLFVERENPDLILEPCIGKVIIAPPELTISIWNGKTILTPKKLYLNDRLHDDYTREFKLTGEILDILINTTSQNIDAGPGPHKHDHGTIEGTGKIEIKGTIINTDTLKVGDYVKVCPCEDGQKWFVDSKYRAVVGE